MDTMRRGFRKRGPNDGKFDCVDWTTDVETTTPNSSSRTPQQTTGQGVPRPGVSESERAGSVSHAPVIRRPASYYLNVARIIAERHVLRGDIEWADARDYIKAAQDILDDVREKAAARSYWVRTLL